MTYDHHSPAERDFIKLLAPLAGKKIALIAPAGGVRDDRIDITLNLLTAAGIQVWLGLNARAHHRYLAGTVSQRLADLHAAFTLPDVAAVWCLRGGYGSSQLIPHIDWAAIPADIPLIGYSDITALLNAFARRGKQGIHGPVATELALPGQTAVQQEQRAAAMRSLVELLLGQRPTRPLLSYSLRPSEPPPILSGGNLTVLASLAGTQAGLRLNRNTLLLLEDIGEAEFRLERSFQQLLHSIDPAYLQAVCLGEFVGCQFSRTPDSWHRILKEWLNPLGIPLHSGLAIGHGHANQAWLYGQPCQ